MADKINVLKIGAILAAGAVSLVIAARSAESYAAETAMKEKTLAEAIIQNQLREEMEKAGEKLEKELEKQEITIVTTSMETKPPVTEAETTPETAAATEPPVTETETETETAAETEPPVTETEAAPETAATEAETEETSVSGTEADEEEIITEFTRGGILPVNNKDIPFRSMFGLSDDEQKQIMRFLIERYFLDGDIYAENEQRPALKEKKRFAAQMERSVITSFYLILNSVNTSDITALADTDFGAVQKEAETIRDDFREKYADAGQYGEQFGALYGDSLKYFDRMVIALGKVDDVMVQYKNAANPLFAFGILTANLNDVIIPEIMAVLEQSFDLVEITQEIFLEGTQGTKLLSRDEVRRIVENPGLALYVINNG